jgi:hypothetical protein
MASAPGVAALLSVLLTMQSLLIILKHIAFGKIPLRNFICYRPSFRQFDGVEKHYILG